MLINWNSAMMMLFGKTKKNAIARDVYEPSLFRQTQIPIYAHQKLGGKGPIRMGIHREEPG